MEDLHVRQNHQGNTNFLNAVDKKLPLFTMYISKLPYIIYRDFPAYGYLTDNRNFGYDTASHSSLKVGDMILSKTGSLLYSELAEEPQPLDDIVKKLIILFPDVPTSELSSDARDFYIELYKAGFIWCGDTGEYHFIPSLYFSYKNIRAAELIERDVNTEDVKYDEVWSSQYHLLRIHVDVSGFCNEHCVHCYIPEEKKKGLMSRELFLKVLDQGKECSVLNITISGGEPMLNPNLPFFIERCRDNNFSINLLSNLTLLSDSLIQEFKRTPLLSIQTSLYSMDACRHDSITKSPGSFLKTKRAIELLHEQDVPMQINCPIIKQNRDSYQDVINWARSLNIEASSDYFIFGSYDCSGHNLKCRLSVSEIESIVRIEKEKEVNRSYNTKSIELRNGEICPVCRTSLCVSNAGYVYPCEGWQNFVLGNILDTSLYDIWNESLDVQMLRGLSYDDFPKCKTCLDRTFCSLCLIRNANESKNHNFRELNPYFCEIAKIRRKISET